MLEVAKIAIQQGIGVLGFVQFSTREGAELVEDVP